MMRKLFLKLSMLLLVLTMSVNAAWAADPVPETDYYWAKLTAKPSTGTGGTGKVFVSNVSTTPTEEDYQNVSSAYSSKDSYVQIDGNVVNFSVYAKADDGSYFVGWSDFNGGTERAHTQSYDCGYEPSAKRGISNALEYAIYATFEPIRIGSYTIEGQNTITTESYVELVITVDLDGDDIEKTDFSGGTAASPFVIAATDETSNVWKKKTTNSFTFGTGNTTAILKVRCTPGASELEIFTATVTLATKAGISIDIPLTVRKVVAAPGEAVLFDGNMPKDAGTVAEMLAVNTSAYTNPILKLSGDYSDAIAIDKNLTLDLNGYTLSNTLTVSAGEVTLAYSPFGGTLSNNVSVTGGKLTLAGGTITGNVNVSAGATLEQNGAAITGTVTNAGTMTTTDGSITGQLASSSTLTLNGGTFTNESGVAVSITGGAADIKRGTISGSTYGVQTTGGSATIGKLAAISGTTKALNGAGGTLTVNNGKFAQAAKFAEGTIVFNSAYFKDDASAVAAAYSKQLWRNTAGVEFRDGYTFFVGDQDAAQASNVSVCRIGQTAYPSLEEALAYANNNPSKSVTIFMENDYTLPAGYYTIPANAIVVVPIDNDQNSATPVIAHRSVTAYPAPYVFRTLTFANGVNMNVLGTIELSGEQFSKGGDTEQSIPGGPYGHLVLKPGSHVTLNNGGELRAWGYVTGDGTRDANGTYLSGEIDARRGSIVREQFQIGDWKGGDVSFTMIKDEDPQQKTHLFPIYEYFIQNVESPVKYHPGSALYCSTAVDAQVLAYANNVKVVGVLGEPAMFLMDEMADAENTWVRKWYDANKDQQVYEVNSGAQLGSIVIDLGEIPRASFDPGQPGKYQITMDSRKYVLPLTNNMKIHLLSGYMQFTQSTSCLPGMEVEVDKESTISIINQDRAEVVEGALYFYDSEQWGRYVQSGKYGTIVQYSATLDAKPAVRNVSSAAALGDAKLIVHGTFQVGADCAVYTTVGKTKNTVAGDDVYTQDITKGGASIISTNADAGTFIFDAAAPTTTGVTIHNGMFVWNAQGQLNSEVLVNYDNSANGLAIGTVLHPETPKPIYGFELCTSALLQNTDGSHTPTAGTLGGKSFCFIDDHWTDMTVDEDNYCFMVDGQDVFYAKPAEYVAIVATKTAGVISGNEDHTFSDKAGAGRLFILMDGCQWWEVEKKDNLYHCIHPNNDTYYYWDDSDADESNHHWAEQRFTITWKNWDGTEIKSYTIDPSSGDPEEVAYSVTYGTMAEYLGSNPTREANIDYTYDFTGWAPELGPVTGDVTYTATYTEKPRMYTVIFQNEGGTEIERHFLTHNEMPVCENVPTRTGFTLQWEPAIAAVTKDAVYRATWLENPPTEYEVTFFDYNGTTILQQGNVAVGTMPTPPANPTGKPATNEFTYAFDHWSPALEIVSATSAKSYTAVYAEVAKTYTVIFQDQNGDEIERHDYAYGETPVCENMPTMANNAQYTYSFAWMPQIQTVQGDATYRAVFTPTTNKYTVTLQCNLPSACTFTGAGIHDYGTSVSIAATPASGYEFVKWQERAGNANLGSVTVEGDITLTAVVKETATTLPGNLELGINATENNPDASYTDLIITSNGLDASSQIINAGNITTLYGNADFVLSKNFASRTWYCVAVPWRVEVNGGIYIGNNTIPALLGTDIEIIYYDGAVRAAQGPVDACWVYMRNVSGKKILEPGRAYMIALYNTTADKITFRKKVQEPILTTGTSVQQYTSQTGNPIDGGWNAIANPALFHAYVNAGSTDAAAQRYNPATSQYEWFNLNTHALVVGEPVYVQAPSNKSIVVENGAAYAPARRNAQADAKFEVSITNYGANAYADHLCIRLDEDKEEEAYVIGQDLAKFGVSDKVAQMWINRYDAKLCINTVAPEEEVTSFPMSLFAPKSGDYTIAIENSSNADDYALYLTYDGQAICNLSDGAYTLGVRQGTDNRYGLRISAKVPQSATGVDEAIVDAQGETRKVLINNQVFIIRGEKVYTIDGQLVK